MDRSVMRNFVRLCLIQGIPKTTYETCSTLWYVDKAPIIRYCCPIEECDSLCLPSFSYQDLDGSGRIRYTEFLAATIEAQGAISEERLAEAFDRLDSDDSGYISAENLSEMLGKDFPQDEIDAIIQEADLTKDNRISYSEFLALWEDKNEAAREDALRELGDTVSNFTESSRSISMEGASSSDLGDSRHAAAEARASFIQQKHRDIREGVEKIEFVDSVESKTSDL